jgi:uncharacterized protein (DUF4415 family)
MPRKAKAAARKSARQWSRADFARAKEVRESLLALAKSLPRGRPKLEHPKQAIKLRLDADVLAAYRKTGRGWQTRINADLRKARKLKQPVSR